MSPTTKMNSSHYFLTESVAQLEPKLNELKTKYPGVTFTPQPEESNYYLSKLEIKAITIEELTQVDEDVKNNLPVVLNLDKEPGQESMLKIQSFIDQSDSALAHKIKESLSTIEECFKRYKPEEVIVAYNGGKDCIVILHLVHSFLRNLVTKKDEKLQVLLVRDENPFEEVTNFVEKSAKDYNLEIISVERPIKDGLKNMLEQKPNVLASVMGTRSCDPYAAMLEKFSPTDPGWPALMRVNPILEWSYSDVWAFIRGLYLPYPRLYDQGFTSLGDQRNTLPNPNLLIHNVDRKPTYKPAYLLDDESTERTGRN